MSKLPPYLLVAAASAAAGIWLRLDGLLDQTPFHDEWHALLAVRWWNATRIFSSFGHADHSIPIALYLELLTALDRLTPFGLWIPFVSCGIAMLLLLPRVLARHTGHEAAWLFGSFLALSPVFVYYSRTARPYVFTAPLAIGIVLAARSWWERPTVRGAAGISLASSFVAWAMLAHAPFVGAGLAPLLVRSSLASASRDQKRSTWLLVLFGVLLTSVLLLPPLVWDFGNLARKAGARSFQSKDLVFGLALFPGGGSVLALLVLTALAVLGGRRLVRSDPLLVLMLAAGAVGQVVTLILAGPKGTDVPLITGRYLLPSGLALLSFASIGAVHLCRRVPARGGIVLPFAAVLILGAVQWLPARQLLTRTPDNFRSVTLARLLYVPLERLEVSRDGLPAAYREVIGAAGEFAVVEAPYNGYLHIPYDMYQSQHRRTVYLGVEKGACASGDTREVPPAGEAGFRLRRFVSLLDLEGLRERKVRFILVHRDPESEIGWLKPARQRPDRFDYDACVRSLRRLTGVAPELVEGIAVFDLERRGRGSRRRSNRGAR